MKKLCIYHGNCADGFGAAWVVRKALGEENVDFVAGTYQTPPPNVAGRDVIIVDFSFKKATMLELAKQAASITIIDHHKSAIEDLQGFVTEDGLPWRGEDYCPIQTYFDVDHSGCMLAWKWFFADEAPPMLLRHLEDRDLWRFMLRGTRAIQANVFSYPYDFEIWDKLMVTVPAVLQTDGEAIERKHFKDVKELLGVVTSEFRIGGWNVMIANVPYTMGSDAGHILSERDPYQFAGYYYDTSDGRIFGLRSGQGGMDVSEIAKQYGGGGHRAAGGFKVPHNHPLADNTNRGFKL